jgi:hypothetical protein
MFKRRYTARAILLGLFITAAALLFWLWPQKPVQAIGANQNDKIVMAAGPMDDGECVFILDTITANLWALRMHPKTGKYNASFFRNIAKDFDLGEKTKGTPQFTMVTAGERFTRFSAAQPIPSVLHITEAVSGRVVAYTLNWNPGARNNIFDPKKPMPILVLDAMQLRGDIVRPTTE